MDDWDSLEHVEGASLYPYSDDDDDACCLLSFDDEKETVLHADESPGEQKTKLDSHIQNKLRVKEPIADNRDGIDLFFEGSEWSQAVAASQGGQSGGWSQNTDGSGTIYPPEPTGHSTSDTDLSEEDQRTYIMSKLQGFVLSFLKQLADCSEGKRKSITLELCDRRKPHNADGNYQPRQLCFPKTTKHGTSLRRITTLLAMVSYIFEALTINVPATKRDIYYRDVALFKKQVIVDNLVDDLGATLGVDRDDFYVRASSKGLFCGSVLSLRLSNGAMITGEDGQPSMIPSGDDIEEMIIGEDIGWILVLEKEAVFQTLAQVKFASRNEFKRAGLIITGKGYPDMATRQLIHKLSVGLPDTIPIFGLVDADPFGIDILSCYAFGSEALYHQREGLVAERIVYLGVKFSDLGEENLLSLTDRDKKKIEGLLGRNDTVVPPAWKDELGKMLKLGSKAEIETVAGRSVSRAGGLPLVEYLERKMKTYMMVE